MSLDGPLPIIAATAAQDQDVFGVLGIDWVMLLMQLAAFLLLVAVLGKYVYPIFLKIIDERQEKINASVKAADQAREAAESAETRVEKELGKARKEARQIVETAKDESAQLIAQADKKAKERGERIVQEAQEEIDKSILAARKSLEKETLSLVKQAAMAATNHVSDESFDAALVKKSLQEAKK
jgi:F-type H+-transporting ATPase subunit b